MLGTEHPDTLIMAMKLGNARSGQGQYAAAAASAMICEALEVQERALGQEHPNTLSTAGGFASTLRPQR